MEALRKPVKAAEGRMAHNNGWNGVNGMVSKHVFDVFDTVPLIALQPVSRARPPQLTCHQPPVVETSLSMKYWTVILKS